jgi:hypothetical protein
MTYQDNSKFVNGDFGWMNSVEEVQVVSGNLTMKFLTGIDWMRWKLLKFDKPFPTGYDSFDPMV